LAKRTSAIEVSLHEIMLLGERGEKLAQAVYKQKGYKLLDANVYNKTGKRVGEIDFVAVGKNDIAFVEVKTRKLLIGKFGSGMQAVDVFKQRKIVKMVKLFLLKNSQFLKFRPHIDVVSIIWPNIDKKPEKVIISANAIEDTF